MKFYRGERTARGCEVTVDGRPLQKRSDMWTRTDQDFAAAIKPLTGVKRSLDGGGSAGAAFGDMPVETASLGAEDAAAIDAMLNEGGPCQMQ